MPFDSMIVLNQTKLIKANQIVALAQPSSGSPGTFQLLSYTKGDDKVEVI